MKRSAFFLTLCAATALMAGCGTTANLAGLSVGVNVAQKGVIAGATFGATSNSVTIGATYGSGTNEIGGSVTVPTSKPTTATYGTGDGTWYSPGSATISTIGLPR